MNQFPIPLKSSYERDAAAQTSKLPTAKIWVALIPGVKTTISESLIAMLTAYAIATNTTAPELQ